MKESNAKANPALKVLLAYPRGFCAGVERAVEIVERTLEQHGKPIYVRHQIVHNAYVVEKLQKKGVVFVDELEDIPASHQKLDQSSSRARRREKYNAKSKR